MKDLVLWDITSVGTAVLDLMHYFFSRKMLVLPLNSPMIYSYGGKADHVPWRKSEPSFWTFSPACQSASCLSKLQTMCIFFSTQSTRYQHFKYPSDYSIMNWMWTITGPKLFWDIWYIRKTAKQGMTTMPSKSLNSIPLLTYDSRKIYVSHITSSSLLFISELKFNIDSSML